MPTASYVSNVLDLCEEVVWGRIAWSEVVAGNSADSKIEIRVRSGQDTTPDVFFRNANVGGSAARIRAHRQRGQYADQGSL